MAATDIRYAVVTGGNQGIGFDICRQLALEGIVVVLTARDEKRGLESAQRLHHSGLGDRIVFHQLDVTDPGSVDALADFIKSQFGHIDILVNNAGIASAIRDPDAYRAEVEKAKGKVFNVDWGKIIKAETYEMAEECVRINYCGVRRMCEALLPLLQSSNSPRIVNVSSTIGQLKFLTNEWATEMLSDAENLTEDRVDEVLNQFLNDFKMDLVRENGWPSVSSAYVLSKAALNAYTRVLSKKHPSLHINAVCPGFVSTNLNHYTGTLTPEEGAASIVRLVLLPNGSSSGLFYQGMEEASFT